MNSMRRVNNRRLSLLIGIAAFVALLLLVVLVDSAVYYNRVHKGVSVSGVDLSGKTKSEALASLTAVVAQGKGNPIILTSPGRTWTLLPEQVGTTMDVEGALKAAVALSRHRNFFGDLATRFGHYFSGRDLALTGTVDAARLSAFVASVAGELDVAPVDAGLVMEDDGVRVIEDADGVRVDQAALSQRLTSVLVTLRSATVEVPLVAVQPKVRVDDNRAAQEAAQTMISSPIILRDGESRWTITPGQIASWMAFRSEERDGVATLIPFMDPTQLRPFLDSIAPEVATEPKDATFASNGSRAWVVAGKNGQVLDAPATAEAIAAASLKPKERTVPLALKITEPDLTTAEAEAMGIKDRLSTYTTKYVGSKDRQQNVRMATKYGTDVILAPGEIYNTDKQFGPRTPARGYRLAPGITGPNTLEDVLGGGICQVSTTIFNAAFFAGLDVVERWNHSIYIDHYPKGRDATVTGGGKNLRFKNDTGHYLWIRGSSDGITTTITIYGTDDGRKVSYSTSDFYNVRERTTVTVLDPTLRTGKTTVIDKGQTGRSVKVIRTVTRSDGTILHRDSFVSRWLMFPMEIRVGSAPTTTTTTGVTTTTTTESPPPSS